MKRCIFHVPYYIDPNWPSGSNIRPLKIIEGLKKNGYEVHVVSGYGEERKHKIDEIVKNIENGVKYDFIYSESSTEPTLLTEKNHFPKYPLLDFNFLNFCKKQGLKVGLFYRDIYWRFDVYNKVPFIKRTIAKTFYMYDLIKYKKIVDVLYLPCEKMNEYIPVKTNSIIEDLPPALDSLEFYDLPNEKDNISIFYVGGISGLYNLEILFKAVTNVKNINLTVCCRKGEWEANKNTYSKYLSDRIKIVHKSGKELEEHYREAHICSLFFEPSEYRSFAMPVKLFEYIGSGRPIISTKGTATGDFVEKNNIGWNIEYNEEKLTQLLEDILNNRDSIYNKSIKVKEVAKENTWEVRCRKIINDLS